jgi:tRNA modification GTPase
MEDTIAAIATPLGEGGIGVIRISGESAGKVMGEVFVPAGSKMPADRRMTYGHIVDPETGKVIDEVLCVFMKAPATYTAEDVVEINCHGGMVPLRKTLELVLAHGARMAEKGEFTKRAFLNGRMDLSQAEAVIDVIRARTDTTFDVAMDQLEGVLSRQIKAIRKKLLDTLVQLTVNIDYPDEDIEEMTFEKLDESLKDINEDIGRLLASASTGRIINEGLRVAIIGKPNVGKSSLMNCLLRESRAIVTEIPGTTRDTIEEFLSIRGIPVILTDTAGIRETDDKIESIGIEKSKESFNQADLIIFMLDASEELSREDMQIMDVVDPHKTLVVLNKTDLDVRLTKESIADDLEGAEIVETSMVDATGVDMLEEAIVNRVYAGDVNPNESCMVTNVRHKDLLQQAGNSVSDALGLVALREPLEIIEIDVNSAYEALGEITGEAVSDDILNEVFSRFCLGK